MITCFFIAYILNLCGMIHNIQLLDFASKKINIRDLLCGVSILEIMTYITNLMLYINYLDHFKMQFHFTLIAYNEESVHKFGHGNEFLSITAIHQSSWGSNDRAERITMHHLFNFLRYLICVLCKCKYRIFEVLYDFFFKSLNYASG